MGAWVAVIAISRFLAALLDDDVFALAVVAPVEGARLQVVATGVGIDSHPVATTRGRDQGPVVALRPVGVQDQFAAIHGARVAVVAGCR